MTLSIALPNKGALHEGAAAIFKEAGYQLRRDSRDLSFYDAKNDIEFFYLRPRDIATSVASGDLDLGVTGRDLLLDSGVAAARFYAQPNLRELTGTTRLFFVTVARFSLCPNRFPVAHFRLSQLDMDSESPA